MREVNDGLNMLYSLIDMVENFGGSGYRLNQVVAEIQEEKERAQRYLEIAASIVLALDSWAWRSAGALLIVAGILAISALRTCKEKAG